MNLSREMMIEEIKNLYSCEKFLRDSKNNMKNCPFCGSGSGPNGTGALKLYDTNTFYCFSCHKYGDIFDLIQNEYNVDFNEALKIASENLNLPFLGPRRPFSTKNDKYDLEDKKTSNRPISANFRACCEIGESSTLENSLSHLSDEKLKNIPSCKNLPFLGPRRPISTENDKYDLEDKKTSNRPVSANFRAYYDRCTNELLNSKSAISYLSSRGISIQTAVSHNIGFDSQADPAQSGHKTPRLIIPTNDSHYIGRSIDHKVDKQFAKLNVKGSKPGIFNIKALYDKNDVVFVTEGVFDALSIIELGYESISLNSTSNVDLLLRELESRPTESFLIICLDNDESGKNASISLSRGLNYLNINNIIENISGDFKDPNEALVCDKESFKNSLKNALMRASSKPDNVKSYIDLIMQKEIENLKIIKDRKTGFSSLDALSGGLYPGLYVIAATSSLGKTTFVNQISDNLAMNGNDVLFFSIEQSSLELVSKSIARITVQNDPKNAVTSLDIRKGVVNDSVLKSLNIYREIISDRISIIECNLNCNISYIENYIRKYIKNNRCNPVVVIDYLQILKSFDESRRSNSKEIIDNVVTGLKRISVENNLTLLVISSVNRTNYLTPIDFESLKESGGIEYTSDVIWGLQLKCLNESLFSEANKIKDKRERIRIAKSSDPREIELVCLKNRYGISNYQCSFNYYPKYDLFVEDKIENKIQGRRL